MIFCRPAKEIADDDEEIPSSDEEIQSDDGEGEEDNESKKSPPKKKRRLEDFGPLLTSTHKNFLEFRNNTIQKWSDKTRIAQGKFSSKNFSAFEQSTLKQIEHILADKSRLLKRTRTRRSTYRVLGTEDVTTNDSKVLCVVVLKLLFSCFLITGQLHLG
jgi:protein AATF/BFR2